MPFVLLLLLTLACLPIQWPAVPLPTDSPEKTALISTALTWSSVAILAGVAIGLARRTRRQLLQGPGQREAALQRYGSYRSGHMFGTFLLYGLTLTALGWGWTVRYFCTPDGAEEMLPGAELLTLAPFVVSLILSWICFYDAERALHDSRSWHLSPGEDVLQSSAALTQLPSAGHTEQDGGDKAFWSRWAYVAFHLRHHLALLLAPLLLIVGQGLLRQFGNLESDWGFQFIAPLLLTATVYVSMPWILRMALALKPMPPGPLRARLEAVADRFGFRYSNLLLWNTRGGVANALVVGIVPQLRYVVFTDRLVSDLTPQEVEAVFGHEIGHVKHHHMLYYLGFMALSLVVVAGAWSLLCAVVLSTAYHYFPGLEPVLRLHADWQMVSLVPFFGGYIVLVFGFLSRRCERQADVYGCRVVSCGRPDCLGHDGQAASAGHRELCPTGIHTFINALEKVARLNGISRQRPGWHQSWLHSTIARRVGFLQSILLNPGLERAFQRRVLVIKLLLLLGLGSTVLFLAALLGADSLFRN